MIKPKCITRRTRRIVKVTFIKCQRNLVSYLSIESEIQETAESVDYSNVHAGPTEVRRLHT
jgi:hypothetical protein